MKIPCYSKKRDSDFRRVEEDLEIDTDYTGWVSEKEDKGKTLYYLSLKLNLRGRSYLVTVPESAFKEAIGNLRNFKSNLNYAKKKAR